MPINENILRMIADPTQGKLGQIGQTLRQGRLDAENTRSKNLDNELQGFAVGKARIEDTVMKAKGSDAFVSTMKDLYASDENMSDPDYAKQKQDEAISQLGGVLPFTGETPLIPEKALDRLQLGARQTIDAFAETGEIKRSIAFRKTEELLGLRKKTNARKAVTEVIKRKPN